MPLFVDTSIWYAALDEDDADHVRAAEILRSGEEMLTSEQVLMETWMLARARLGYDFAERFWEGLRKGAAHVEPVIPSDYEEAWHIGRAFADQQFSLVDRTSFAMMQRLQVDRVASLDSDFAIFRYGPGRKRAFTVVR